MTRDFEVGIGFDSQHRVQSQARILSHGSNYYFSVKLSAIFLRTEYTPESIMIWYAGVWSGYYILAPGYMTTEIVIAPSKQS